MLGCFDTRKPLKPVPLKWQLNDVFFITKNKKLITKYANEWFCVTEDMALSLPFFVGIQSVNNTTYYEQMDQLTVSNSNMEEAFSHIFPEIHLKGTSSTTISTPQTLLNFLAHKEQKKKSGPKQKLIDSYVAVELENVDVSELVGGSTMRNRATNYEPAEIYVKISKVKDGVCCLRWIRKKNDTVIENLRIYVDGKNFIGCKKNNAGEYVQFRLSSGKDHFAASKILPFNKENFK